VNVGAAEARRSGEELSAVRLCEFGRLLGLRRKRQPACRDHKRPVRMPWFWLSYTSRQLLRRRARCGSRGFTVQQFQPMEPSGATVCNRRGRLLSQPDQQHRRQFGSRPKYSNNRWRVQRGREIAGHLFLLINHAAKFYISGLSPNENFTLFLYAVNRSEQPDDQGAIFTAGGASFDTKNGTPSSEDPGLAVTGLLTGETTSTALIIGTWAFNEDNVGPDLGGEIDWSGFQLAVASSAAAPPVPEPGTFALLAGGLALLGVVRRRRSQ